MKTPRASKRLAVPTDRVPRCYRTSHGAKDMMAEWGEDGEAAVMYSTPLTLNGEAH